RDSPRRSGPPGPAPRPEAEPCSRALAQARVYLGQLRGRVSPAGPEGGGRRDYLVEAARQLRLALERDVSEDYEEAFNHYKNGVDVLLRGVQVDPNKERREAVKRKITQYLRRAEEIFDCHLQRAAGGGNPTGYSSLRFRPIRTLSSAVENLRRCKVVGVIDKVQIVQDPATGGTFILKSLPKSHVETRERQTIIPHGVPFMVKLLCYYVSEDSIFLHLEHVQGETLWSHLRSKCCVQQGSADSNTIQALRDRGREDGVGSLQGSSQTPVPVLKTLRGGQPGVGELPSQQVSEVSRAWPLLTLGQRQLHAEVAPSSSAKPCGPDPVVWEPSQGVSLTCGWLSEQPPSGRCRALASRGHGWRAWAVKEEQVQLWAAEILLALEGLHQQGVLCRDLNPRNLLLDAAGRYPCSGGSWGKLERCKLLRKRKMQRTLPGES
uniref:Ribosomal protein S6 kinase like 1 n=1 Tax=Strix occidentalis caurina TaxID=311401 RepID=A0A8D0FI11_STROC